MLDPPAFDLSILAPHSLDIGLYAASQIFKAPIALFYPGLHQPFLDEMLDNPVDNALVPLEYLKEVPASMTFKDRVVNTLMSSLLSYGYKNVVLTGYERGIKELLDLDETPDLWGMASAADFLMVNSHPVFAGRKAVGPNTALVGGIHTREADPENVPEDVREFLDEADEGAIYVSFGSVSLSCASIVFWADARTSAILNDFAYIKRGNGVQTPALIS